MKREQEKERERKEKKQGDNKQVTTYHAVTPPPLILTTWEKDIGYFFY